MNELYVASVLSMHIAVLLKWCVWKVMRFLHS